MPTGYYSGAAGTSRSNDNRTGNIHLNSSIHIPNNILFHVYKCLESFAPPDKASDVDDGLNLSVPILLLTFMILCKVPILGIYYLFSIFWTWKCWNISNSSADVEIKPQNERAFSEFEQQYNHLLKVNFIEFLEAAKGKAFERYNNSNISEPNSQKISKMATKNESKEYQKRFKMRQKLPAMQQHQDIIQAVQNNQVILVVGSTGCGKTTQIPQILLDHYMVVNRGSECRIVCTQPRRISAIAVADRVAYERDEKLGNSVGYQIRLESCLPRNCDSILYCTTGILIQKLKTDPLMSDLTAVILDEIHERSVETDLLMGLLKLILPHRPDLRVVLMSATVSEKTFCDYFNNCHTFYIHGTLFPVEVLYMEDILQETGYRRFVNDVMCPGPREVQDDQLNMKYKQMIDAYVPEMRQKQYDDAVIETLRRYTDSEGCSNLNFLEYLIFYICHKKPPGAILVFLPGISIISKLHKRLRHPTNPSHQHLVENIRIYPLHSMLPTANQRSIFEPPPPGKRKIILSTILAETSVTIDDVVYVIDSGRTKISDYDLKQNIQTLEEQWVSKANSQQRKGRAGRVQSGVCYNLYTRMRERNMLDVPVPEMLRNRMESVILNLKLLHMKDPYEFLQTLITTPDVRALNHGLRLLKCIGALDKNCNLTPLGLHLAYLPIDPQMGKMILMSALFRCVDPITSACAGLSLKSPFYTPLESERKLEDVKRDLANGSKSDHLLVHNVIEKFRDARDVGDDLEFCDDNFLGKHTLMQIEKMKQQFTQILMGSKFLESPDCCAINSNADAHNVPLLRAVIASGLYPNVAFLKGTHLVGRQSHIVHELSTPVDKKVKFQLSSVNSVEPSFNSNFFVYFQKQRTTSGVFLLDATMIHPMALLLFGDDVKQGHCPLVGSYLSVADTYFFKCDMNISSVILQMREQLDIFLSNKALNPSPIQPNSSDEDFIKAIHMLLSLDDAGDYDI